MSMYWYIFPLQILTQFPHSIHDRIQKSFLTYYEEMKKEKKRLSACKYSKFQPLNQIDFNYFNYSFVGLRKKLLMFEISRKLPKIVNE